uniref:Uncharacterized protein n=1 Tax=Vitis vinifera TaxID=29760 RepID=F6H0P6_VITVI
MSTGAMDFWLIGFYVHNHVFIGVCFNEVLGMFTTSSFVALPLSLLFSFPLFPRWGRGMVWV